MVEPQDGRKQDLEDSLATNLNTYSGLLDKNEGNLVLLKLPYFGGLSYQSLAYSNTSYIQQIVILYQIILIFFLRANATCHFYSCSFYLLVAL